VIVLDPINQQKIKQALHDGIKIYSGGNCTVSLMLTALGGLLEQGLVEWVNSSTYQAASGAGAFHMKELLLQNKWLSSNISESLISGNADALVADEQVSTVLRGANVPQHQFGAPLIGNVLPWIDSLMENGQTREEWKAQAEANKILGLKPDTLKIDGVCVRVGSMRCHSQALTVKLTDKNLTIEAIVQLITKHNAWVKVVPNNKADTLKYLTPVAVSGSLDIAVGRLRKLSLGEEYLSLFTVGDQLLWGAAEPLRRMLNIVVEHHR
ncbi:MAG: aspartate-semialdehyde dehydrogenase, partial [Burkholderiales bacterium]|nr:aspartate-semialdehyde dehydrogenase [Burkholderiales bacterium]